jgi:hypothetical protein
MMLPKISLPKLSNFKYNFTPILRNKFILYAFLAMTLVQVIFFVNSGDMTSVITMGLIGFLTSFFSKNMIVILCVALTVSSVLKYGAQSFAYEGLENQEGPAVPEEGPAAPEEGQADKDVKSEDDKKKKEADEFAAVQKQILDGVEKMEPLLQKAEAFMDKYGSKTA